MSRNRFPVIDSAHIWTSPRKDEPVVIGPPHHRSELANIADRITYLVNSGRPLTGDDLVTLQALTDRASELVTNLTEDAVLEAEYQRTSSYRSNGQ